MKFIIYVLFSAVLLIFCPLYAQTGKTVNAVKLLDVYDNDAEIPYLGEKVLALFYIDPDVQGLSEPLSDALEEVKFPLDRFAVAGIADCKDTWLPNSLIRMKARKKQERFPQALIFLDNKHTLASAWDLGDCNNKLAILVIGRDMKIKYFRTVSKLSESKEAIPSFLEAIRTQLSLHYPSPAQ